MAFASGSVFQRQFLNNYEGYCDREKNMTYVKTKKELQDAVKRKDEEIIVVGKLAKKLKEFAKIQRL